MQIDNQIVARFRGSQRRNQRGFSLIELMVAVTVMLVVLTAVFALARNSLRVAMTTYEMTDAQQNMRIAQEFINRDLMNAGDGLRSIQNIQVPASFVTNYITATPPTAGKLQIFTTDNDLGAVAVMSSNPATIIRAGTDRQTILSLDPEFTPNISLAPGMISASGNTITFPDAAAVSRVKQGEIYFLTSTLGGTFGTITSIDVAAKKVSFEQGTVPAPGDPWGLNNTGASGQIKAISASGTLATSLQRMRIIQYYVTSTGLLMRRIFGIEASPLAQGMRDSIIAEHVLNVQFNYALILEDATGVVTPSMSTTLTTPEQCQSVRQVEVRVTVETPHVIQNGLRQPLTTTTTTSVRNMQFFTAK